MKTDKPIITRFKKNPILTSKDVPYPVATVHNAGIVKHNDRYIMLFRSHLRNGRSIIGRADSKDGFSFTVHPKPFLIPSTDTVLPNMKPLASKTSESVPVEGVYLLTYSAYSRHGVRIALARTRDFEKVERIALITQADLRNVVIFPETVWRQVCPFGPAAFRNFPLVDLDFLFSRPGSLGRFPGDYEAGGLSLG
jgi:predicted GH43/DUF377 family glycosyl hydrolase